jgi:hypothetical protein
MTGDNSNSRRKAPARTGASRKSCHAVDTRTYLRAHSGGTAGNTGWSATIDACHDLMAIAFGTNNMDDTFERACRAADRRTAARPQDPRLDRLRRLLEDEDVSLERAGHEIMRARRAPEVLVEALTYSLRRGIDNLAQPNIQRRLSAVAEDQLEAVCVRVQTFQPKIAEPWSADDVDLLISAWRKFRGQR